MPQFDAAGFRNWWLSSNLAFRGHSRQAYAVGGDSEARVAEMAMLGGVPPAALATRFGAWLRGPPIREP